MYKLILIISIIVISFPISGFCWEWKSPFGSSEEEEVASLRAGLCNINKSGTDLWSCVEAAYKACNDGNRHACKLHTDVVNRYTSALYAARSSCFTERKLQICNAFKKTLEVHCWKTNDRTACNEISKVSKIIEEIERPSKMPKWVEPTNLEQCLRQCRNMDRYTGYPDSSHCDYCFLIFP